jgi:uncharacterized protein (TIGR02246 family)
MRNQLILRSAASVLVGLALAAVLLTSANHQVGSAGQAPATQTTPAAKDPPTVTAKDKDAPVATEQRPDDRAAIQKALTSFTKAFQKGDGKAVAAHWTTEGEYISDDGVTFTGRPALEKAYQEYFSKNPDNALEVEVDSIRFPSRDNAVVEGHFKLHQGKKKELTVSRCSFLYSREDGNWLIAIAREWPGDGLSLRDLEWLIGSWEAKRDDATVTTNYEWTANKTFIRCQFSIKQEDKTFTGMQMVGKDPATGLLRLWTFEDSGGIGDSEINREGKKWIFTASGVTPDGRTLTCKNIMTPIDNDSFLWQSVERTLDEESLPDLPPIKVTRVKAK